MAPARKIAAALAVLASATTVFASHNVNHASQLHARYAQTAEEALEERWPMADVHLPIRHGRRNKGDLKRGLPDEDPFYIPPSNLGSLKPGTIVRTRKVTVKNYPNSNETLKMDAYQLYYRTTAVNTTVPIGTVTTLMVPHGADLSKLVEYPTAEDAVSSRCAPSYTLTQKGGEYELLIILGLLNNNWPVSTSDYEGPDSAFTAGHLSGHGVLDSIRAVLKFKGLGFEGFNKDVKVQIAGYSGGALATGWAAALQPTYAPELPIIGAAAGGTPANVSQVLLNVDGGEYAGEGFAGVGGLIQAYKEFEDLATEIATPTGQAGLAYLRSHCLGDVVTQYLNETILSTKYQSLGDRLLYNPIVARITAQNVLGSAKNETPKIPLYIYHSVGDHTIPIAGAQYAVKQWCKNGAPSVIFETNLNSQTDHVGMAITGIPKMLSYLTQRFAGWPLPKGCDYRYTLFPPLDIDALGSTLGFIVGDLSTILTNEIGLGDRRLKATLNAKAAAKKAAGESA